MTNNRQWEKLAWILGEILSWNTLDNMNKAMVEVTQVNETNKTKCKKFKSRWTYAGYSHYLPSALLCLKDDWRSVFGWPRIHISKGFCPYVTSSPWIGGQGQDLQNLSLTQQPLLLLWWNTAFVAVETNPVYVVD